MEQTWSLQEEFLSDGKVRVTLSASVQTWTSWAQELVMQVRGKTHGEVRLDLPRGWTLYWRWRSSDSRFLVAHPEKDQWVATVSLSDSVFALLESGIGIGAMTPGSDPILLNELDGAYPLSNLIVALGVLEG